MNALDTRRSIQTLLHVAPDGIIGTATLAAINRLVGTPDASEWPAAASPPQQSPPGDILKGDGTWPWVARVDGSDIVVINARATCFGGDSDPQDNGETASGVNTKGNPGLVGCSLPMNGKQFHMTPEEHAALDGSPIPKVPWRTIVRVTHGAVSHDIPVIELGPGKRTGNALDLTIGAAKLFDPHASATNFSMICTYRIIGGAIYLNATA